jgi:hypothetical protein
MSLVTWSYIPSMISRFTERVLSVILDALLVEVAPGVLIARYVLSWNPSEFFNAGHGIKMSLGVTFPQ